MKRFLVENTAIIHTTLFIVWLIGAMISFCIGHKTPMWIPLTALIAMAIQVVFAVAEADWTNDICEGCGYNKKH